MIVRVAVAVALAAALLAVSLPEIERARVDHADARIAAEVDRLERVATALAADNDLVPDGGTPARTHLTLHLPERSWGASGTEAVRIPPPDADADVVWRATDGETRQRTVPDVELAGPPDGLVLGEGGRHRLLAELRRSEDGRTVRVRRPEPGAAGGG